jgi:hypothetical protein
MKDHGLWMLIGYILSVLLIFILSTLGYVSIFLYIVLMFGCHLFMGGHKGHGEGEEYNEHEQKKEGGREFH